MTLFYGTWTWRWIWTLSPGQDIRHFIECSYLDLIAEHLAAPSVRNSAAAVWSVVILFLEKRSHFLVGCLTPLLFSELKTAVPSFRGRQVWTKFGAKFQNGSTRLYCRRFSGGVGRVCYCYGFCLCPLDKFQWLLLGPTNGATLRHFLAAFTRWRTRGVLLSLISLYLVAITHSMVLNVRKLRGS